VYNEPKVRKLLSKAERGGSMSGKGKKRKGVKLFINPILLVALLVVLVAIGIAAGSYLYSSSRAAKTAPPSRTKTETEMVILEEPFLGSPDAPVTIIEFSDFQCPFCGAVSGHNQEVIQYLRSRDSNWEPIVPKLKPYIEAGQVKFVYRNFAFLGPESQWAAEAAECAHEQGRFWEYHDKLFANQRGENQGAFSKENLKRFAAELGLDAKVFNMCLDSGKYAEEVQDDHEEGQRLGVRGTPAFFINGRLVSGAQPFSVVKGIIEEELQKTKE